jgi:CRISPR-associated protein Csm3
MFRSLHNQARLVLKVQPSSPILVKSAGSGLDPTRPEMEFVTVNTDLGRVEYLPGSTLKGSLRAFTERLLLALGKKACDPIEKKSPCADREHRAYGRQCDACKIFGSPNLAGRLRVVDGLPWRLGAPDAERTAGRDALKRETRANVAIDRASGASSAKGLFDMDVVVSGAFYPEITLRNYQLWQLAMLKLALAELDGGFAQIGSAKSRGLGRVSCAIETLEIRQVGPLAATDELRGIGQVPGEAAKTHRLAEGDKSPLPDGVARFSAGPIASARFAGDEADKVLSAVLESEPWKRFLEVAR